MGLANKNIDGVFKISNHSFFAVVILFLFLPVAIFMFAWLKLFISIPAVLLLGASFVITYRNIKREDDLRIDKGNVEFSWLFLVLLFVLSMFISFLTGIGEYIWTSTDHWFRRAIYRDLVNYDWPVYFDLSKATHAELYEGVSKNVAFSYYFSYWMIPALIGKLFGFAIGNFSLLLWNSFGLTLIVVGISILCKRQTWFALFALLFFGGFDIIPFAVINLFPELRQYYMTLERHTEHFSYIGNLIHLRDVFNQVIPAYLIVILLLNMKNRRSIGFVASLCFAYSPWATVGLIPISAYLVLSSRIDDSDWKKRIRDTFTITNIVPAIVMLIVFVPFYLSHKMPEKYNGLTANFYGSWLRLFIDIIILFVIELTPSLILFGKKHLKDGLFWVVIASLCILPVYHISPVNDLSMRGSMPLLFVLTIYYAIFLNSSWADIKKQGIRNYKVSLITAFKFLVIILISCAALYVLYEIVAYDILQYQDCDFVYSMGNVKNKEYCYTVYNNYYAADYGKTFFYKYMVRV